MKGRPKGKAAEAAGQRAHCNLWSLITVGELISCRGGPWRGRGDSMTERRFFPVRFHVLIKL